MGTDIHGIMQKRVNDQWEDIHFNFGEDRHYQLFAVLAGVRNGYGFAGCLTGEAVVPIAEPRGLPEDFTRDYDVHPVANPVVLLPWQREEEGPFEKWMGTHSFSWLTGQEMLDGYEKLPVVTKYGVLSRQEYEQWDKVSEPESYSGGVCGPDKVLVNSAEEADRTPGWTYIRCTWQQGLKEELAYFFEEVRNLVQEHGEIRYVFGFDS